MQTSIIAAVAWNGVIGRDGNLPWHLPADLQHFKRTTMGHHVLMGRKTWQSIGRPLPGRKFLVLSASGFEPGLPDGTDREVVTVVAGLQQAHEVAQARGETELFVAGGGNVYAQAIDSVQRMYITRVDSSFDGDAFFPPIDEQNWAQESEELRMPDDDNPYPLRFQLWRREAHPPSG